MLHSSNYFGFMIKLETNLKEVVLRLSNHLTISNAEQEKALRAGALDAIALVQSRVQQHGRGTEGQLVSKSKERAGAYSKKYGKVRQEGGFQTSFVDLTYHGDLWRNWQILSSSPTEVGIGFMAGNSGNTQANDLAEYLENYYGSIFGLTEEEQMIVSAGIEEKLLFQLI